MGRVERIVHKFMDTPLKELRAVQTKKYIEFITDQLIRVEGLSAKKIEHMPYIELACLVNHVGGNPCYDWEDHDSYFEQMFYFRCLAGVLLDGNRTSIPVKLFLSLPLQEFYLYLDSISSQNLMLEFEYNIKSCCSYKEGYTILDFLSEKGSALNKPWAPIEPAASYEERIKAAHRDIGRLLVDSFRKAFPQSFYAEKICEKYPFSSANQNQ